MVILGIYIFILGIQPSISNESTDADILVYSLSTELNHTLWLYNPQTREKIELATHSGFSMNQSGIVAYSIQSDEGKDIYLLDVNHLNNSHINITSDLPIDVNVVRWSPDGQYLTLYTVWDDGHRLHVWDGEVFIDVNPQTSQEVKTSFRGWSPDSRYLLFESDNGSIRTLYAWDSETSTPILLYETPSIAQTDIPNMPSGYSYGGISSPYHLNWNSDGQYLAIALYQAEITEIIFIWNGEELINITPDNLPLPRIPDYYYTQWSFDGRLAFHLSWYEHRVDHANQIYIWDGNDIYNLTQKSHAYYQLGEWNTDNQLVYMMANDLGSSSYIFIWNGVYFTAMPKLGYFYTAGARWNPENHLVFSAFDGQIYSWDGQEAINLSQNAPLTNLSPHWGSDGRWASKTFSPSPIIYVRDSDNHTLFEIDGGQDIRWSYNGYLTFCRYVDEGWGLFLWDGEQVIEITRGREIYGEWLAGMEQAIVCSSG